MKEQSVREYFKGMWNFELKPFQLAFATDCVNHQKTVGVFCRQTGKSETTSKTSILLAHKTPNSKIAVFAPTDEQAGLLAEKIRYSIGLMPVNPAFQVVQSTKRDFEFSNNSKIFCRTVGDYGSGIRGHTASVIILEEASYIKDSIVQEVILPMGATTNAKLIKIGTPSGMNHFYESSQNSAFKVHTYGWEHGVKSGLLSEEYVNDQRASMPSDKFRTEMGAEFIPDQDAYFGYELINKCVDKDLSDEFKKQADWTYYLGVDIARLGGDSTVYTITRKKGQQWRVARILEQKGVTTDKVIDQVTELDKTYHFAGIYLDETGLGAGPTDILKRKYGDLKVEGVTFTIKNKMDIYSTLKMLMEADRLKYPKNPKLIAQLRDFRYERIEASGNVKLHHSEHGFDDYCDSLALSTRKAFGSSFIFDA